MANLKVLNGDGDPKYLKGEGAGSDADPFVPVQTQLIDTNNASGDAFGRFRVSNPATLYAQKFLYSKSDDIFFDEELSGVASTSVHDPANACVDMDVGATSGDFVIRQSKQRINYQAGKSQLFFFTGLMEAQTGTTKRIGCFQGGIVTPFAVLDGICFETVGSDYYVKIYKGGAAAFSAIQSAWNLDTLDGTGPSGLTLDDSKCQIFVIDYEWLGVGRVRMGFNINGMTVYVHEFLNSNNVTDVYMRSPNRPVRYELRSTGSNGSLKQICCSVQSEGGQTPAGLVASIRNPSNISISNSFELLKAIRLKSDHLDATVLLEKISTIAVSNGNYEYVVCWNPVIGGTETWVDVPGAAIQEWTGNGSNAITPSLVIDGGFTSQSINAESIAIDSTLHLGSNIDGTRDVIALGVRTLAAPSDTFRGGMTVRELI